MKPCGTQAAYYRHRRHGEEPCDECRKAAADYERERRHRNGRPSRSRWEAPRCGTTAGYQHHRKLKTEPCEGCREAWAEYHRFLRRGIMIHRRYDSIRASDLIADVLDSLDYPMTTDVLVSHVLDIKPGWKAESVRRAVERMVADGRLERFQRLGEWLLRLNDIPPRWDAEGV